VGLLPLPLFVAVAVLLLQLVPPLPAFGER
jgi:hypothetical protein